MKALFARFAPANFNDLLALLYFPFIVIWLLMLAVIYHYLAPSFFQALGLGTATGIILSKFNDIYQYYFRKAKGEK